MKKKIINYSDRKCLLESIQLNKDALDWCNNEVSRISDLLKYNENLVKEKDDLKQLQYITCVLKFVGGAFKNGV